MWHRESSATQAMDLVEEILDISHELSTLKIKKLLDAVAQRIPHSLLPRLVFKGHWHVCREECFAFQLVYGFGIAHMCLLQGQPGGPCWV